MTTPLEEVIRKVVDDWVDRPNGHVAQHIARAVLAHLAERREQDWDLNWYSEELGRLQKSVDTLIEEKAAQAAAHAALKENHDRVSNHLSMAEIRISQMQQTIELA